MRPLQIRGRGGGWRSAYDPPVDRRHANVLKLATSMVLRRMEGWLLMRHCSRACQNSRRHTRREPFALQKPWNARRRLTTGRGKRSHARVCIASERTPRSAWQLKWSNMACCDQYTVNVTFWALLSTASKAKDHCPPENGQIASAMSWHCKRFSCKDVIGKWIQPCLLFLLHAMKDQLTQDTCVSF